MKIEFPRGVVLCLLLIMSGAVLLACGQEATPAKIEEPAATKGQMAPPEAPALPSVAATPLAGTEWQLVQFQSMDDAQGTTVPEDSSLYTISFNANGMVAMRLHCNRGQGDWNAEASSDESGSITFGPMAVTKALCPPGSLDEKIATDMPFVRGYLLREGQLHLSLMADGGIYSWAPWASGAP